LGGASDLLPGVSPIALSIPRGKVHYGLLGGLPPLDVRGEGRKCKRIFAVDGLTGRTMDISRFKGRGRAGKEGSTPLLRGR